MKPINWKKKKKQSKKFDEHKFKNMFDWNSIF